MDVLNTDELAVMRARARHRLIGALLLVLLLVIGVPLLLDPPALTVPSAPPAALPAPAPVSSSNGAGNAQSTAPSSASDQPLLPMAGTATVANPVAAEPAPASVSAVSADAASAPVLPPAPLPAPAAAVVPPVSQSPAPAPVAATARTPTPAAPPGEVAGKDGRPVLVLSAREREREQQRPPAGAASGRAEPRPAAEKATPTEPRALRGWYVQYGVFFEAPRAETLAARLAGHGILVNSEHLRGARGAFTRLRSGPFNNRPAADAVLARARALGENAILVHQ